MGLFDKFKKKDVAPEPTIDERKLEEVAAYQSKDDQAIKNLQTKLLQKSTYIEGTVYCKLWDKEIEVSVYDDATLEYADKCVEAMNNMPEELVDAICKAAKKYCNSFRDEIGDMLEEDMTVPIDESSSNSEIMQCFEPNVLIIDTPEEPLVVGYQLECSCDWEVEHGMEIDILDDILVNLSSFDGGSPWLDYSDDEWNYALEVE